MADTDTRGRTARVRTYAALAIVVVAIVVGLIAIISGRQDAGERTTDVVPQSTVVDESQAVADLGTWTEEEMPSFGSAAVPQMAAEGFVQVADALRELVERAERTPDAAAAGEAPTVGQNEEAEDGLLDQVSAIRARVATIRGEQGAEQRSGAARAAAVTTADVLQQLQQGHYVEARDEAQVVFTSADAVSASVPLQEQRGAVEEFFRSTYAAVSVMQTLSPTVEIPTEELPNEPVPERAIDPAERGDVPPE